ncbi:hypothetical protein CBR_g31151 [Chara braunii]|uniref:RING-type domain-containing protein n=1 Tax=Chara braunii TaxID=69332 RepID=A0A388LEP9_CHABU|nr:hypothetical protein CBR_g31151 [Chara braunii]|eukprot:GBG80692.1 hypothetical protein CBR_g31151 [Chara braunii]
MGGPPEGDENDSPTAPTTTITSTCALHDHLSSIWYHFHDTTLDNGALGRAAAAGAGYASTTELAGGAIRVGFAPVEAVIARGTYRSMRAPFDEELAVKEVPRHYFCIICDQLMSEAVAAVPCGHEFCSACLRYFKEKSVGEPLCPICRQDMASMPLPARRTRDMISRLKLHCPFGLSFDVARGSFVPLLTVDDVVRAAAGNFCTEILELSRMWEHVVNCPSRPVGCSHQNEGCREVVRFASREHDRVCPFNSRFCRVCGYGITEGESLDEHEKYTCQAVEVGCPNANLGCKERIARGDLAAHRKVCPFEHPAVKEAILCAVKRKNGLEVRLEGLDRDLLMERDEALFHRVLAESLEGQAEKMRRCTKKSGSGSAVEGAEPSRRHSLGSSKPFSLIARCFGGAAPSPSRQVHWKA